MEFRSGKPVGKLKKLGKARGTGTTVFFRPDPEHLSQDGVHPQT